MLVNRKVAFGDPLFVIRVFVISEPHREPRCFSILSLIVTHTSLPAVFSSLKRREKEREIERETEREREREMNNDLAS